jgi:hypothetical protein
VNVIRVKKDERSDPPAYVTTAELAAELRGMRWEVRFLVVLGLILGQVAARVDLFKPVKIALVAFFT